jgi:hypothetical protein
MDGCDILAGAFWRVDSDDDSFARRLVALEPRRAKPVTSLARSSLAQGARARE